MNKRSKPPLREGFTTGTAAAAAASGAVTLLLAGCLPAEATVALPPFTQTANRIEPSDDLCLAIPLACGAPLDEKTAWAEVVKDGGDDPDATHGIRIRVFASFLPFNAEQLPANFQPPIRPLGEGFCESESSVWPGRWTSAPLSLPCSFGALFLYAGRGIGIATLPGLPIAPGEPAVNPEPRKQIAYTVGRAAKAAGYSGPLHILLSAEEGEKRALRTLNRRLGIVGGISILGTRGTVRPYSHEAWKETILQGLNVSQALGLDELLLCTGRRSERLGFGLYPCLPPQAGIQAADFAAFTLKGAVARNFKRLRWVCFPGKLLKLAQGLEWTHAKEGAADLGMLSRFCRDAGGKADLLRALENMPTAAGAFALMRSSGHSLHRTVLQKLGRTAYGVMQKWIAEENPAWNDKGDLRLHVFSQEEELLLSL